jgi:hypothetical protein
MKECTPPLGAFKGENFVTPNFIAYYRVPSGYAELSSGSCMGILMYGVTHSPGVWEERDTAKSSPFFSRADALEFIENDCEATDG